MRPNKMKSEKREDGVVVVSRELSESEKQDKILKRLAALEKQNSK